MERLQVITVLEDGRIMGGFRQLAEEDGRIVGLRLGAKSVIPFRRSNPPEVHHGDTVFDVVFRQVTLDRGSKHPKRMMVLACPEKHLPKAGYLVCVANGSVKPNGQQVTVRGYGEYVAFELKPQETVRFFQGNIEYAISLDHAADHPQCTLIADHAGKPTTEPVIA